MHFTLHLEKTAYTKAQLKTVEGLSAPEGAQIAMAGRSNVGKSTLLNCLANRKKLAKTSSTPGKTRSLNFYRIEARAFDCPRGCYLVDLPGYGYARCSKTERQKWADMLEKYFADATRLAAVVVLLDARLPPQKLDLDLVAYLRDMGAPLIAALTKADKCKQKDRSARLREWSNILGGAKPLLVSAVTGHGRDELLAAIAAAFAASRPIDPS